MVRIALRPFPPVLAWSVLAVAAGAAAIGMLDVGVHCVRVFQDLFGSGEIAHATPVPPAASATPSPAFRRGFAGTSISQRSFDELARLSAKIANEQGIDVVQLLADAPASRPTHLNQSRIRLQVRGDYAATKVLLISLLSNFPGLTLEHLSMRHDPAAGAAGSPTKGSQGVGEQATIELIQYSVPGQVGS